MKCPVCKTSDLNPNELEPGLGSMKCPNCAGNWIVGSEYWKWLEQHGPNLPEIKSLDHDLTLSDTQEPLDCPECRWRMVKYKVGHETGFSLDHCHSCKGIWLDKNEWEILKRRNLHDDLNSILTAFWQTEALKEERKKRLEQIYVHKLGADSYEELKRVREWLDKHPHKQELLAYLIDQNPLGI